MKKIFKLLYKRYNIIVDYSIFIDYLSTTNLKKYFEIINCQLKKKLNLLSQQKLILSRVNLNNNTKK